VKCTHGATIGQLMKTRLFYLRSRGSMRSLRAGFTLCLFERMFLIASTKPGEEHCGDLIQQRLLDIAQAARFNAATISQNKPRRTWRSWMTTCSTSREVSLRSLLRQPRTDSIWTGCAAISPFSRVNYGKKLVYLDNAAHRRNPRP